MVITLPSTFNNSFWTSPDYRRGAEVLYSKLEAGLIEGEEIISFLERQSSFYKKTGDALRETTLTRFDKRGLNYDDGASLKRAFEGLLDEVTERAATHDKAASVLDNKVTRDLSQRIATLRARVQDSADFVFDGLDALERETEQVNKLKAAYDKKCQIADEASDYARFSSDPSRQPTVMSPSSSIQEDDEDDESFGVDDPTLLPRSGQKTDSTSPTSAGTGMFGFGSLASRASGLVRSISKRAPPSASQALVDRINRDSAKHAVIEGEKSEEKSAGDFDEAPAPKLDKGKGKEVFPDDEKKEDSKPAVSPAVPTKEWLLIGGVWKETWDWSRLFAESRDKAPSGSVDVPVIGKYDNVHTGSSLVAWFRSHIPELDNSLDKAFGFCKEVTEELSLLKLVGQLGNAFYDSDEYSYRWDPKAFNLHHLTKAAEAQEAQTRGGELEGKFTSLPPPHRPRSPLPGGVNPNAQPADALASPIIEKAQPKPPSRSGTIASYFSAVVGGGTASAEPKHEKARREASEAEKAYKTAAKELDVRRLRWEEAYSEEMRRMEACEMTRLESVKTALTGFDSAVGDTVPQLQRSIAQSADLTSLFVPFSDLKVTIERHKTGQFKPTAVVPFDHYHRSLEVNFGIDLRLWSEIYSAPSLPRGPAIISNKIPAILTGILSYLAEGYTKIEDDEEKRRTWIYEAPLAHVHTIRQAVNYAGENVDFKQVMENLDKDLKFDKPMAAAAYTLKVWLLELEPPLIPYSQYDEAKRIYPTVGAGDTEKSNVEAIKALFQPVPRIHVLVLNAVMKHFEDLVKGTKTPNEGDIIYLTKLGLSLGRGILRPKSETSLTINDRVHVLLLSDLIRNRESILDPVIEMKNQLERERTMPKRKRTALIDARLSRKQLSAQGADEAKAFSLLQQQRPGAITSPPSTPRASQHLQGAQQQGGAAPAISAPVAVAPEQARVASPEPTSATELVQPPVSIPEVSATKTSQPETTTQLAAPAEPEVIPLTPTSATGENQPSEPETPAVEASSGEANDEDKPLSSQTSISRIGSGNKPSRVLRGPRPLNRVSRDFSEEKPSTPPPAAATHSVPGGLHFASSEEGVSASHSIGHHPRVGHIDPSDYAPKSKGAKASAGLFKQEDKESRRRSFTRTATPHELDFENPEST